MTTAGDRLAMRHGDEFSKIAGVGRGVGNMHRNSARVMAANAAWHGTSRKAKVGAGLAGAAGALGTAGALGARHERRKNQFGKVADYEFEKGRVRNALRGGARAYKNAGILQLGSKKSIKRLSDKDIKSARKYARVGAGFNAAGAGANLVAARRATGDARKFHQGLAAQHGAIAGLSGVGARRGTKELKRRGL